MKQHFRPVLLLCHMVSDSQVWNEQHAHLFNSIVLLLIEYTQLEIKTIELYKQACLFLPFLRVSTQRFESHRRA
jgi:hypothetical protein